MANNGYDTSELEQEALQAIERNFLTFFDDISLYTKASRATLYNHGLDALDTIRKALDKNIVSRKQHKKEEYEKAFGLHKGQGYIYIIHCTGTNYYKIGLSKIKPSDRISALQSGCPFELKLIHMQHTSSYVAVERKAHKMFKGKRVRGEWFDLDSSELINLIKWLSAYEVESITLNVN